MRISRYLAHCGIASRRTIDVWIEQGRLKQGAHTVPLGALYDPGQPLFLDGNLLELAQKNPAQERLRVLLYHKPPGEICTRSDPSGRPTVFQALPQLREGRWISVGRLDYQTSGLLIFVTDGTLAHQLMHPKFEFARVYEAKVQGPLTKELCQRLVQHGVMLDGQKVMIEMMDIIAARSNACWVKVILRSGVNRAVRRIFESVGCFVVKLKRTRYGSLTLPENLRQGQYQELREREIKDFEREIAKGGT